MFIYIERSVFTSSLPALLWPSHLTEIFTSSPMPCQVSFHSYHGDLKKKKKDHVTPAYLKLIKIPIAFWIKYRFPSDLISYHVFLNHYFPMSLTNFLYLQNISASGPLHFLGPLPGVHFSLNLTRLIPSSNQGLVFSRHLIKSSLQIFHYHVILFHLLHKALIIWNYLYLCLMPFFATRMETQRSAACLFCSLLYCQHFDIYEDHAPFSKSRFRMAYIFCGEGLWSRLYELGGICCGYVVARDTLWPELRMAKMMRSMILQKVCELRIRPELKSQAALLVVWPWARYLQL